MRITQAFSLSSTPPSHVETRLMASLRHGKIQKQRTGKTWVVALSEISVHWIAAFAAVGLLTLAGGCGPGGPFGSGGGPSATTRQSPIVANNKDQAMTCALYAQKYKRCDFPCEVKNKQCVAMVSQSPCLGKLGKACAVAKQCKWVPIDSKNPNGGVCLNINTQVEICDVKAFLDWQDFCAKRLDKGAPDDATQKKLCEQEINGAQPCVHQAQVREGCAPIADTGDGVCGFFGIVAAGAVANRVKSLTLVKEDFSGTFTPCGNAPLYAYGVDNRVQNPAQYCGSLLENKVNRTGQQACELGSAAQIDVHGDVAKNGTPVCT
ncbi:MAG: hypothetical protein AAF471_00645, partial [Myxococcota bacterium]